MKTLNRYVRFWCITKHWFNCDDCEHWTQRVVEMNEKWKCVRCTGAHIVCMMVDGQIEFETEQTKLNTKHEWKTESLLLFVWMHFAILITYNRFGNIGPNESLANDNKFCYTIKLGLCELPNVMPAIHFP